MAGETSLLSRHFSSHVPVEQVPARLQRKCFHFKQQDFWILKETESLEQKKKHVVKGNLEFFPQLLGLEDEDGYHQVSSLIENNSEELQKKLNIIFPPFQHKCMTG
jgi:hypothetical protein